MESLRSRIGSRPFISAAACALLLQSAGCDVGRSVLVPLDDGGMDAAVTDASRADVPTDASRADVPTGDVPSDTGASGLCGPTVDMVRATCASAPNFLACLRDGVRPRLSAQELVQFDALTTCFQSACPGGVTLQCIEQNGQSCAPQLAACMNTCDASLNCAFVGSSTSSPVSFDRCRGRLTPALQAQLSAAQACLQRVCGNDLTAPTAAMCVRNEASQRMCAAEINACAPNFLPPSDAGGPPMDVPATDVPATDVPVTGTCSSVFGAGFPMCSGNPSFWPCITGLRGQLSGAELVRFNALTTCVEAACGPNATEMCATTHCFEEVTACYPVCASAISCAVSTCTGMNCSGSFTRCGMALAGTEAASFAALRTCFEQACGPTLDPACVDGPTGMTACAARLTACGVQDLPTDGGAPTDLPVATDAPMMCPAGQSLCDGTCVDLQTSQAHCGVCNAPCPAMTACMSGTCVGMGTCAPPQTQCGSACVSLQTNPANCGACGTACTSGQTCVNGACVGTGNLRFTLTWDRPGDLDLHVTPPCGMNIDYRSANMLICGGTLDRDDRRGVGPENVFFGATAARGEYLLCMVPFSINGTTTATLRVFEGAVLRQTFTRTYATGTQTSECSRTSPFFVGAYTY